MDKIETINIDETNDIEAHIFYDEDPESPREWDNMGTIYYRHRDHKLGENELTPDSIEGYMRQIADNEGFVEAQDDEVSDANIGNWIKKHLVILPLFCYEHGAITISTGSFSCPWDSGQFGFIVAKVGAENMDPDAIQKVLEAEIKTFDEYLRGDVYGYEVTYKDEQLDSCWGFFGMEYVIQEAKSSLKYEWEQVKKQQADGKVLAVGGQS